MVIVLPRAMLSHSTWAAASRAYGWLASWPHHTTHITYHFLKHFPPLPSKVTTHDR